MAIFWFWYSRILPCGTDHKWWKPLKNATFHTFDGCKKFLVGCLVPGNVSKVAPHPREHPEKIWDQYNKIKTRNFQKTFPPPKTGLLESESLFANYSTLRYCRMSLRHHWNTFWVCRIIYKSRAIERTSNHTLTTRSYWAMTPPHANEFACGPRV